MNWLVFSTQLRTLFDNDIKLISHAAVSGGDIHHAFQLHTNQGNFFLKTNQLSSLPMFETEARSLNKLSETLSILVPKVIATGQTENQAWLLLEFMDLTANGDDFQRGKDLALMHQQIYHADKAFGWGEDNYIGHTTQNNTWRSDWPSFFGQNRLAYQLNLIEQTNGPSSLIDSGQLLINKIEHFFQDYQPKASPLHGDLWGGNSAFLCSGEAVIFDPASYYGDRETDIAMTELFGGFSAEFYRGYNTVFPLDTGYKTRKDLYNLYHLLNHFTLFGGAYGLQTERLIQTLLKRLK